MKPIEEVRKGDWVWSVAPETGDPELKQVEDVFVNETDEIVHVRYGDTEIDATPTHPFYTPDRGWVSAVNLRAGDRLQLVNGEYVTVEQVQHEILESPVKVYNFEVQDNHTYYVGGDDDDSAVLVHNKCSGKTLAKRAGLPTEGKIRFVPPEKTGGQLLKQGDGFVDKFGNVWEKGSSRTNGEAFEWDVQLSKHGRESIGWLSRDGKHVNVSLKGRVTHK